MIVREVGEEEKRNFNEGVNHPLQTWEWGEFKQQMGAETIRLGVFDEKKLISGYQLFFHSIPRLPFTIGYFPRGPMPDGIMLETIKEIGIRKKAIFIKLEPSIASPFEKSNVSAHQNIKDFLLTNDCREGRPLFTRWTFQLDLTKTENQLLEAMKPKTRYNIRVAQRHGVEVVEDNSNEAFEKFIKLFFETTKRQHFYGHTPEYYRLMRKLLVPAGIEHLFLAKYKGEVLAAYIFFTFKDFLYYPYGASTRDFREAMAPYAAFWQAIQYGKERGLKTFDMWGALGPNPDLGNPWFGFHRFKEGFGGQLTEFIGTYDLVINRGLYPIYNFVDSLRWKFLRLRNAF